MITSRANINTFRNFLWRKKFSYSIAYPISAVNVCTAPTEINDLVKKIYPYGTNSQKE